MLNSRSEYSSQGLINRSSLTTFGVKVLEIMPCDLLTCSNIDNVVRELPLHSLCLYLAKEPTSSGPVTKGLFLTPHCILEGLLWPPAVSSTTEQRSRFLQPDSDHCPPSPSEILHCKQLGGGVPLVAQTCWPCSNRGKMRGPNS